MGYGEISMGEMKEAYEDMLLESLVALGADLSLIRYISGSSSVEVGRLGTERLTSKAADIEIAPFRGAIIYNPSEEVRSKIGVKHQLSAIVYFRKKDLTFKVNAEKDKVVVSGQSYTVLGTHDTGTIGITATLVALTLGK